VTRGLAWVALAVALVTLAAGFALALWSAFVVAGSWWLAPTPWIDWGLTLIVAGLVTTAASSVALVVFEPVGRWRLLAVPPGVVLAFAALLWAMGLPTSGGPEHDARTILYSVPEWLAIVTVATLLLLAPLAALPVRRRRARRAAPAA
jgi:hypothetical protein